MATVETVKGPIDTAELGETLMHEHVFVLTPELDVNYPEDWDEEAQVAGAVTKLRRLAATGVRTIVDPTVLGLGRDVARVARIAAQVDLHIVVATGLYTYNDLPFRFQYAGPNTPFGGEDPLVDYFVADITDGIAGTRIKAAFLKCAIDAPGLTPGVERTLRAVAQAHRRTGVPITVHTAVHNRSGLDAQRVLASEGVDLTRVVIGHVGDSTDLDYLKRLADAGSLLGMDRFGIDALLPTAERVATVAALCEAGYGPSMVLSHDASCYIDWFPNGMVPRMAPNWHYEHIANDVLPALRERGVSDAEITTMLVDNPRRYFEQIGAY